jgi:hypothetical protein
VNAGDAVSNWVYVALVVAPLSPVIKRWLTLRFVARMRRHGNDAMIFGAEAVRRIEAGDQSLRGRFRGALGHSRSEDLGGLAVGSGDPGGIDAEGGGASAAVTEPPGDSREIDPGGQ